MRNQSILMVGCIWIMTHLAATDTKIAPHTSTYHARPRAYVMWKPSPWLRIHPWSRYRATTYAMIIWAITWCCGLAHYAHRNPICSEVMCPEMLLFAAIGDAPLVAAITAFVMFVTAERSGYIAPNQREFFMRFPHQRTIYTYQDAYNHSYLVDAEDRSRSIPRAIRHLQQSTSSSPCIICLEDMDPIDSVLPCGHVFHRSCIQQWMRNYRRCPSCRKVPQYGITRT